MNVGAHLVFKRDKSSVTELYKIEFIWNKKQKINDTTIKYFG